MGREAFRKQVSNVAQFVDWAKAAAPRDAVIYHIGNLVSDRASNLELSDLAATVNVLQESAFVIGQRIPLNLSAIDGSFYLAVRTGGGRIPQSLASGTVDATLYRAIQALRGRDADVSAPRMIRDHLSVPDEMAKDILARLWAREYIKPAEGRGYQLTALGARMLL
jgi:hypothetical protein